MVGLVGAARIAGTLIFPRKYAVGPVEVDTVVHEGHTSSMSVTRLPVETGYVLTDHVVFNPVEVTIEGVVSDVETEFGFSYGLIGIGKTIYDKTVDKDTGTRSSATWKLLKTLQQQGEVFSLQTSLSLYENMVLESLSVSRDNRTINALPFTARLAQIKIIESQNFTGSLKKLTVENPVTDTAKNNQSTVDRSQSKQDQGLQKVNKPSSSILFRVLN